MYQELKKVLQYIVDKTKENNLQVLYSELAQSYEMVATSPSSEIDSDIVEKMQVIRTVQTSIEPDGFDFVSLHAFHRLDEYNVLGLDAITRLNSELSQISNNPHAASLAIQGMSNQIDTLSKASLTTLGNLDSLWGETKILESGYVELQIVFDDKVAINTFKSMQHQADFWDRFLKVTNLVLSDGSSNAEIVSLFKINPSGVSLKTKAVNALIVLEIFRTVLEITTNLTGFKKTEASIYLLPAPEPQKTELLNKLHESEQEALDREIESQTIEISKKLKNVLPEGDELNVSKNGIRAQLKELYQFCLDGGSVSVVNVAQDERSKITPEYYKLPDLTKSLKNTRKELRNPDFPKALLSPDEKKIMKHPPTLPTKKVEPKKVNLKSKKEK